MDVLHAIDWDTLLEIVILEIGYVSLVVVSRLGMKAIGLKHLEECFFIRSGGFSIR